MREKSVLIFGVLVIFLILTVQGCAQTPEEQVLSYRLTIEQRGGLIGARDYLLLTDNQLVYSFEYHNDEIETTRRPLSLNDTRTLFQILMDRTFRSLEPPTGGYGCKTRETELTVPMMDIPSMTLLVEITQAGETENKEFVFHCGTGDLSTSPSIINQLVNEIWNIKEKVM